MVTRKGLIVKFKNTYLPSYDVYTDETCSRFLTRDGTAATRKNDHCHLDRNHTDEQADLCRL